MVALVLGGLDFGVLFGACTTSSESRIQYPLYIGG